MTIHSHKIHQELMDFIATKRMCMLINNPMNFFKKQNQSEIIPNQKLALVASYWALSTALVLIIIKSIAYFFTGSNALLASLIDTIGDAVLSIVSYCSIKISLKPADHDHRFGHGKAEGFFAQIQASFLIGSAVFITFETIRNYFNPTNIEHHALGIAVSIIAIVLTFILVLVQKWVLKRAPSLAVEADRNHYKGDIFINIGVILAFSADYLTQSGTVDLVISLCIAAYLAWTGLKIGKKATDMLMDREIPFCERQKIIDLVKRDKRVFGLHDLRTRQSGMDLHISFDVELDGNLTLEKAHDIIEEIDLALLKIFPHAEIIIHMDPQGHTHDPRHKREGVHY